MQTTFGKGNGNCYTACLASILEIPLEDIEPFPSQRLNESDQMAGLRQHQHYKRWVRSKGFVLSNIAGDPSALDGVIMIAGGMGPRGISHAVVWRNGECIHDPIPGGTGLVGEPEEYEILVPFDPVNRRTQHG